MPEQFDILIIGCGSLAGFFASFANSTQKLSDMRILIVEGLSAPFKKISASGNGRCNYSNKSISYENYRSVSPNEAFTKIFFQKIVKLDLINFFEDFLIFSRIDEYNRVFPYTNSAKTIVSFFTKNISKDNFKLLYKTRCVKLTQEKKNKGFSAELLDIKTNKRFTIEAKKVIAAFGGAAYAQLGTDGSSFSLLKNLGHKIIDPLSGICALETSPKFKGLSGIKLDAIIKYESKFSRKGEILFTDYGISGPNVLYLSNLISLGLLKNKPVQISVDFLPEPSMSLSYYKQRAACLDIKSAIDAFSGTLNNDFLAALVKLEPQNGIEELYRRLKDFTIKVTAARPLSESQVSLGGVECSEVNPHTLESKLHSGLFIGGEALDYTGGCGGYNIHLAAACAKTISQAISGETD